MRAWMVERNGEPADVLRLVDREPPTPGPGELCVDVSAAAVGMPDVFLCRGTYAFSPTIPFTPGQEAAGVVTAAGDGVTLEVGTRVTGVTAFVDGRGGFAEQTVIAAANAYPVPDEMDDAHAAAFRIGSSTAWIALVRRAVVAPGEQLVVLGAAGGSGLAAVQLGHALGARVLAVVAGSEKAAACRELGADVAIDRELSDVRDAVLDATDGRGADVVFDPVGGAPGEDAMRWIADGGRYLAVGFAAGRWPTVDVAHLVGRNFSVLGVYAGAYDRAENEADHAALLALVATGALRSPVTRTMAFDEVPAALELVATGASIGKVVVSV
jgi:NADPH2:quinone reductase